MLSLIKAWQCDIWPHTLRLRLGNQVIACHKRTADQELGPALATLLGQRSPSLAWSNSVEFHLDTDDLMFMVQPWLSGVTTPQEFLRLAHLQAIRRNGTHRQRSGWQVRFESTDWEQPALVAGLKQECWEIMRTLAKRERLRFRGVSTPFQPLLRHCGRALPERALFITISQHHTRIASRINHVWHDVNTLTLPQQEVHRQLRIIARLSGMTDCPHYVINAEDGQVRVIMPQENEV